MRVLSRGIRYEGPRPEMARIMTALIGSPADLEEGRTMRQEEKLLSMERKTPQTLALCSRTLTGWSAKLVRNAALLLIVGLAGRLLRPWILRYLWKPPLHD